MSPTAQLKAFAQSVYLVIKNRYFDDIEGEDGVVFVNQIIDWTNQYLDELENIIDANGNVVNWNWTRTNQLDLGQVTEGDTTFTLPSGILAILPDQHRGAQITVDGVVKSRWGIVTPDQVYLDPSRNNEPLISPMGTLLEFSRAIKDTEDGGTLSADVISSLPRLSLTNVRVLNTVKPKQLLVLGVAKNATLPDIVQGGLSPSYVQKYNDLLQAAITRNSASGRGETAERDNFSHVRGIY